MSSRGLSQTLPVRFQDENGFVVGLEIADVSISKNVFADTEGETVLVIGLSGGRHADRYLASQEVPLQYGIS